jgi:hypothetical protein
MLEARRAIYMWSTDAEQEAALRRGDSLRELQEDEDEYHEISGFDLSEISFAESPINVFNYIGYRNGANIVKYYVIARKRESIVCKNIKKRLECKYISISCF